MGEYVDRISGAKYRRPHLEKLMKDARKRKFGVVLVWKFDRFARSTRHLIEALEEFQALGVDFISQQEAIDTSTPMGKMVFTVISAVAELERSLIRERVIIGLERVKRKGVKLGRPEAEIDLDEAKKLKDEGLSYRQIADQMGVNHMTLYRKMNPTK